MYGVLVFPSCCSYVMISDHSIFFR